jgi:glycosyltransferase involved in cell wall biosynthesis
MKIGFDVSTAGTTKTGCGYFTYSLLHALAEIDSHNHYLLYPTFGDHYWDPDWEKTFAKIPRRNFQQSLRHRTYTGMQTFWRHPPPDTYRQLGQPHIIHSNNFFCPGALSTAQLVYTLYDLSFIEYPDHTLEETRIAAFHGVFNASLYAKHIIAISEYTRRHFLAAFPHYPAECVSVVYPASRFSFRINLATPSSLASLSAEKFWLSVGTLEPRKNHQRLLKAYAQLKTGMPNGFPLVFAGVRGWLMKDFEKQIADLGLQDDLVLLGYVNDAELQWLYQNCFAFIYPSLFEGFGMPVLEAMSLGAAVIASNTTSLPEIVGDAGLLVDPKSEDSICRAMKRLSDDSVLRRNLHSKACERSQLFSWQTSARQVLDIYQSLH